MGSKNKLNYYKYVYRRTSQGFEESGPSRKTKVKLDKAPCKRTQYCWIKMLHVASVCTPCCMLLHAVGSCCAMFETSQTLS